MAAEEEGRKRMRGRERSAAEGNEGAVKRKRAKEGSESEMARVTGYDWRG